MKFTMANNKNDYECEVILIEENESNDLLKLYNFDKELGDTLLVADKNKLILFVGTGNNSLISSKKSSEIVLNIAKTLNNNKITSVLLPIFQIENKDASWFVSTATKIIKDNDYQITKVGLKNSEKNSLKTVIFADKSQQNAINKGLAIANGMNLAKELADMPSNICTPTYLAKAASDLAKEFNLEIEVLEEKQMQKLGMNSLLSVSKGSIEPAKFITLTYKNNGNSQPFVLVGKGITFDSGGISLKPGNAMDEMKYDMCGSASVLGTMQAIATLQAKINLTIIIPAVENMPAHNASKPGDVVKSMSGQTIEILNTDAEGRLILCDALTYAKKFKPKTIIDIATLTGSVIIALGKHHSGLMANDDSLAKELLSAGKIAQDSLWQLPLDEEYDELLKSNFADMANIGGREAGSTTAGCFLARFTKDYKWAHLDIAGTAWNSGKNKGATGRPVALLCEYLLQ